MVFAQEKYKLDGKEILLRSATPDDADMLIDYLKTVACWISESNRRGRMEKSDGKCFPRGIIFVRGFDKT